MLTIDGSLGEGGGQILRTALALSVATGTPFRLEKIRAGRAKPGLLRQHLTAVTAAMQISDAEVDGAQLGSGTLVFRPRALRAGDYAFAIGTAGSTMLVLQTVLPPLLVAPSASSLTLEGGTHNPAAPPFDFLAAAFLPLIERMGPRVEARLEKAGFYPAGGGRVVARITPTAQLRRLDIPERGAVRATRARAVVVNLPRHIAERELAVVHKRLGWEESSLQAEVLPPGPGPGNVLTLEVESEQVTEVFCGFGEHNVRAEAVAAAAVDEVRRYLVAGVPVGTHLADQLLLPMALAGGGSLLTLALSRHTTTNIEIIRRFLDLPILVQRQDRDHVQVVVGH